MGYSHKAKGPYTLQYHSEIDERTRVPKAAIQQIPKS